jgi:hypothetical protein
MSSDVEVLLDDEDRYVVIARPNGRRHPRRARTDDNDVGLPVPTRDLGLRVL